MSKNMGNIDRGIRVVLAIVIGLLYYFGFINGIVATTLMTLAVIFVLTSMVSVCPLYTIFGFNTCPLKKR